MASASDRALVRMRELGSTFAGLLHVREMYCQQPHTVAITYQDAIVVHFIKPGWRVVVAGAPVRPRVILVG